MRSSRARRCASTFSASCASFSRTKGAPSAAVLPLRGECSGLAVSSSRARVLAMSHWPSGSCAIRPEHSALCIVVSLTPRRRAASRVEGDLAINGFTDIGIKGERSTAHLEQQPISTKIHASRYRICWSCSCCSGPSTIWVRRTITRYSCPSPVSFGRKASVLRV